MHTRLLFVAVAALPCAVAARTGAAEVREDPRGGPCFSISPREDRLGTPDFQAVTVSDGRHALWRMSMPPGRASFALALATCVPYGARTAALPQTPAAPLEPGKVYQVRLDARPGRAATAAASYEARFCLARQRDGATTVRQVDDGEREGRHSHACASSN